MSSRNAHPLPLLPVVALTLLVSACSSDGDPMVTGAAGQTPDIGAASDLRLRIASSEIFRIPSNTLAVANPEFLHSTRQYTYADDATLLSDQLLSVDGEVLQQTDYTYDDEQRLAQKRSTHTSECSNTLEDTAEVYDYSDARIASVLHSFSCLKWFTRPSARKNYEYDDTNRVSRVSGPSLTTYGLCEQQVFSYDADGKLAGYVTSNIACEFESYDDDTVVAEGEIFNSVEFDYDSQADAVLEKHTVPGRDYIELTSHQYTEGMCIQVQMSVATTFHQLCI